MSRTAHNGPYVHAGFRLPKGKPLSARVVSRISAQLPSNLAQRSEQGKCIPVAWLSRRGTFSVRQLRRYREPGDRYRGAASWHAGANSRERAADCARWRAAPTTPGARGYAGVGSLLLRVLRFAPGAEIAGRADLPLYAALLVEGRAAIEGETLAAWDFIRVSGTTGYAPIRFPNGATLLAVSMQ